MKKKLFNINIKFENKPVFKGKAQSFEEIENTFKEFKKKFK